MRPYPRCLAALCTSSLLALAACSDDGSAGATPEAPASDAGEEADSTAAVDAAPEANAKDAGKDQEAGPCTPNTQPDPPDDDGLDTNCDGADGVVGRDLYVDPKNGDDTNTGTAKLPFKTLAKALELSDGTVSILVSAGALSPEPIAEPVGLRIYGGYEKGFLGAPERSRTVFHADAGGLHITSDGSVALHHLTVEGSSAVSADQPSSHGLVFEVAEALLDDVTVRAGDALSGTPGKQGSSGSAGQTSQAGDTVTCGNKAQPAYAVGAAANAANLAGQPPGSIPSKTPAPTGEAGVPGTDGQNADGVPALEKDYLSFAHGTSGSNDGTVGTGGPGGDGYLDTFTINGQQYSITGGRGGNGGCPGNGGFYGVSAGGAAAVVVLNGSLTVSRSRLATGFAGTGGDGGKGGSGGKGGPGGTPNITKNGSPFSTPATCSASTDPLQVNCAAYGGAGGEGGRGGTGGGGAGGWTIGVLTKGVATVVVDTATEFDLGKPGTGGMGGVARAPDGQKAPQHHIP